MNGIEPSNGWDIKRVKQCEKIGNRAGAYIWLCNESCNYYKTVQTVMSMVIAIMTFVLGSTGIPTLFTESWGGARYFNLAIQILIMIVGVFGIVSKSLDYTERVRHYSAMGEKNTYLFMQIRGELIKDFSQRMQFDEFYKKIDADEIEIRKLQTKIPYWVFNKYTRMMGSRALSYEELFGDKISDSAESTRKLNAQLIV